MESRRRQTFLFVFLLASAGLMTALSLVPRVERPNLLGNVGSFLAFTLYGVFGAGAWGLPPLLLYWAAARARGVEVRRLPLKVLGLLLSLVSVLSAVHLLAPGRPLLGGKSGWETVTWSGRLGEAAGDRLLAVFSFPGTLLVCALLLVFSAWLLEKEMHLVRGAALAWEGLRRAAVFFAAESAHFLRNAGPFFAFRWAALRARAEAWCAARRDRFREARERKKEVPPAEPPPRLDRPLSAAPPWREPAVEGVHAFDFDGTQNFSVSSQQKEGTRDAESSSHSPRPAVSSPPPASHEEERVVGSDEEEAPTPSRVRREWKLPSVHLLKSREGGEAEADTGAVARTLEATLRNFNVDAKVVGINPGPTVTQYEVQPAAGVKITRIASLADDLALALSCGQVRVVAPLPGKAAVGVEVPNRKGALVTLKELLAHPGFLESPKKLHTALGKDIAGAPVYGDLDAMPHVLVAGSTGSGKSVCVNTIIASLLFRATPEEVRLVLVDPKRVEMTLYRGLPHLALPVVNDPKEAQAALRWLVGEMEERYSRLAALSVRDLDAYNAKAAARCAEGDGRFEPMPYIVVLIDELADLMMTARDQVEDAIARLAQMSRAVGIHLVLATQRPSVEVLTGTIKANFPSRIAFQVFSKVDSRTILDMNGAEALLGKGDMLYLPSGAPKPLRLQGAYVSVEDLERLVDFWTSQGSPEYLAKLSAGDGGSGGAKGESDDELYAEAVEVVVLAKQASTSLLQRRLKIGYSRAARLLDEMEQRGVVGPADGNKPRKVLYRSLAEIPGRGGSGEGEESGGSDETP